MVPPSERASMRPARKGPETAHGRFPLLAASGIGFNEAGPQGAGNAQTESSISAAAAPLQ